MKIFDTVDMNNLPLQNPATYSSEDINSLFDLTEEEAVELTKVIDDSHVAINKVYSNSKTEERLAEILIEANEFATEQLGKSNFLSIDLATSVDEVVDEHILYLIADENANTNTYNQYVLIGGEVKSLGSTQCNLTNYVTNEQLNEKLEDYAKKNEVLSDNDIVTTIDENSTNTTVPSALATYNAIKDMNMKTYTTLNSLGFDTSVSCTVGDIYLALPSNSMFIYQITGTNYISDCPSSYGLLKIIKADNNRFEITFKNSTGESVSENIMYIGTLKGSDGSGLVWNEILTTDDIVTSLNSSSTDTQIPSALSVYTDAIKPIRNKTFTEDQINSVDIAQLEIATISGEVANNIGLNVSSNIYVKIVTIPHPKYPIQFAMDVGKIKDIVAYRKCNNGTWGAWKNICSTAHANVFKDFTSAELSAVSKTGLTITKARYYIKNGFATVFCAFSFENITVNVVNSITSLVPMFPPVQTSQDFTYAVCKEKVSQETCYGSVTTTGLFAVCFANAKSGTDYIYMATYPISESATIPTII